MNKMILSHCYLAIFWIFKREEQKFKMNKQKNYAFYFKNRQLKKQLSEREEGKKKHFSEQGIQQTSPLSTLTNASIRENPSNCRVFAISSICFLHLCKAFSLQRK